MRKLGFRKVKWLVEGHTASLKQVTFFSYSEMNWNYSWSEWAIKCWGHVLLNPRVQGHLINICLFRPNHLYKILLGESSWRFNKLQFVYSFIYNCEIKFERSSLKDKDTIAKKGIWISWEHSPYHPSVMNGCTALDAEGGWHPMTSFSPGPQLENKAANCICFMMAESNQHTISRDAQRLMTYFLFLNAFFHFYPN